MKRQQLFVMIGILAVVLLGIFYWSFFRTPEQVSGDISESVIEMAIDNNVTNGGSVTIFEIDSTQSVASFTIAEVLRGEDYVVLGTTNQVGGQVAFDPNDLRGAQIGEIVINARTFVTDNDMRNNAIQNRILFTDDYEFIQFASTAINGLPNSVAVGDSIDVEIVGDLTIKDVTKQVTFAATLTYVSVGQIEGNALATITYEDYGVSVPLTPSVSFVADELTMMLDFVAVVSQ